MRIKIGTRGSALALIQANIVEEALEKASHQGVVCDIITYQTSGDKIQHDNLKFFGGKGLFTKEIDAALSLGDIDIAVHSMKDMATILPDNFCIACTLTREDPRDAFINYHGEDFFNVPREKIIGTSSIRRSSFVQYQRADLTIKPFRGNVVTRLNKLQQEEVYGTFLAMAGINRLHIANELHEKNALFPLSLDDSLCAPCQGIMGIVCLDKTNETIRALLDKINDKETYLSMMAERAFLSALDGSCSTAIGAFGHVVTKKNHDCLVFNGGMFVEKNQANNDGLLVWHHTRHTASSILNVDNVYKEFFALGLDFKKKISMDSR